MISINDDSCIELVEKLWKFWMLIFTIGNKPGILLCPQK